MESALKHPGPSAASLANQLGIIFIIIFSCNIIMIYGRQTPLPGYDYMVLDDSLIL